MGERQGECLRSFLKKTDAIDIRRYYRLRFPVLQPPKLYGLPKLHKPNIPMRPIVSFCGSPTYQLSKYLTTVLQPLTDQFRYKLQSSTENFIDSIKTAHIPDDHRLVSFDVKSLFTSIPLKLALDCTETAITTSTVKLSLVQTTSWTYLTSALRLLTVSTTANTTNSYMEQLWARQFPLLLQKLLCKISRNKPFRPTLPLWLRHVDDTFTAVHKDKIDTFHEHLNRQNPHIQFTKEIEENGKIPFLDCLVSRDENKLRTTIYRKPTHTDRLLDQSSYNPTSHKPTTIRTLTRRAQLVCDSTDSLTDETNYLNNVFSKNNYNADFI